MRSILVVLACLSAGPALAETMARPMGHHRKHSQGPADQANEAAMQAMMRAMAVPSTGDPDRDFVTMMIPHHQGAIDMAKVELRYGKDPHLQALARSVIEAQEKEIADMKAWLAAHK